MIPAPLLLVPLGVQAAAMFVDELYFHRRRGLPRWERLGHPIDTGSVLLCYLALLVAPRSPMTLYVYAALAAVSCLLVTKDEFIHAGRCEPAEHWLHAVLFVLHPITFLAAALLWLQAQTALLAVQAVLILLFGMYQFTYWNLGWRKQRFP